MKLLNLTELSHLGICWADRAIFLKVACGQAFAVRPPSRTAKAWPQSFDLSLALETLK